MANMGGLPPSHVRVAQAPRVGGSVHRPLARNAQQRCCARITPGRGRPAPPRTAGRPAANTAARAAIADRFNLFIGAPDDCL